MSVDYTWIEEPFLAIGRFPTTQEVHDLASRFRVLINVTESVYQEKLDKNLFVQYLAWPVSDMSVPTWSQLFQALRYFRSFQKMHLPVFLHCYAGLGRSGFFAALFCMMRGDQAKEAIEKVRSLRVGAIETDEQTYRLYEIEPMVRAILDSPEQTWFEARHMVHILRNNCPWDKIQTYQSLIRTIIDESFETVEAIRKLDMESIEEEIGDLMIQPLLISEIASERDDFSLQTSLEKMMEKLLRRHPHVFSNMQQLSPDGVVNQWNGIKLGEQKKQHHGIIEDIMAISHEASSYGFDWDKPSDILLKMQEEVTELSETVQTSNKRRIEEELGDVFFTAFNIARYLKIDPIKSLERGRRKFEARFRAVQRLVSEQEQNPALLSSAQLDEYWKKAKQLLED